METLNNSKGLLDELEQKIKILEEKEQLKNAFLANFSHEIRTPLNGILGFAELLEFDLVKIRQSELAEYASNIQESARRLLGLLNNIIAYFNLENEGLRFNPELLFVDELIEEQVIEIQKHFVEKEIDLQTSFQAKVPVWADKTQLKKILTDIVHNAFKFTPKGSIEIKTYYDFTQRKVNVEINDTGTGIDKAIQNKLFMPFFQETMGITRTHQGGGISLALARKMIELMGGGFKLSSEKNEGTKITLCLPVKYSVFKPQVKKDDSSVYQKEILIVEDDKMNRILFEEYLKKFEHVFLAADYDECLNIIDLYIKKKKQFDLILMDIKLNDHYNGVDLLNQIRQKWPEYRQIPVLALSGLSLKAEQEMLEQNGFNGLITKPVNKLAFVGEITKQLKSPNPAPVKKSKISKAVS